jgi:hypothetical protein
MTKNLLRLSAIVAGLALAFTATASGQREVVRAGNLIFTDDGGISPTKRPRHGSVPITARIVGTIGTADGSHPPALRSVHAEVDKTIEIDAVGLPTCRQAQLEAHDTTAARRACGEAIVGSGEAEVEVSFPEQASFSATGPIVLFNGGVRGATTTLFLHAYVKVPAPTAIVTKVTIVRIHDDHYGHEFRAEIPKIAGGAGSATRFELKIGRQFTYKGKQKSFLRAGCPSGSWQTRGDILFADATRLAVHHVFPCISGG